MWVHGGPEKSVSRFYFALSIYVPVLYGRLLSWQEGGPRLFSHCEVATLKLSHHWSDVGQLFDFYNIPFPVQISPTPDKTF